MIIRLLIRALTLISIFISVEASSIPSHDWVKEYETSFSKSYTPDVAQRLIGLLNHIYLFMEYPRYSWVDFCEQIKEFGDNTLLDPSARNKVIALANTLMACKDAKCIKNSLWDNVDWQHMHPDEPIMVVLRSKILEKFTSIAEQRIFASLSPERQKEIQQRRTQERKMQEEDLNQRQQEEADSSFVFKSIVTGTIFATSYSLYKCCCN